MGGRQLPTMPARPQASHLLHEEAVLLHPRGAKGGGLLPHRHHQHIIGNLKLRQAAVLVRRLAGAVRHLRRHTAGREAVSPARQGAAGIQGAGGVLRCRCHASRQPTFSSKSILSHTASKKLTNGLETRTGSSSERNSTVPTEVLQDGGGVGEGPRCRRREASTAGASLQGVEWQPGGRRVSCLCAGGLAAPGQHGGEQEVVAGADHHHLISIRVDDLQSPGGRVSRLAGCSATQAVRAATKQC